MSIIAKQRLSGLSFARMQSASSINTFRQCPRKYYYQYIQGLPTTPSIHLIRGHVVHSILEDFFRLEIEKVPAEDYGIILRMILQEQLSRQWAKASPELSALKLSENEMHGYLQETEEMIHLWHSEFMKKLDGIVKKEGFHSAFRKLTPKVEEHIASEDLGVHGYVDAIHEDCGRITIIDYKTSKKNEITEDYRLQLAIYALLYHSKTGRYPEHVGLFLLRHGELLIDVDDSLLEFARLEIEKVHKGTSSVDQENYPCSRSALCNWGRGQCDFFCNCNEKLFK